MIGLVSRDRATVDLLREWLSADGYAVEDEAHAVPHTRSALVIVDIPFARHGALEQLRRVSERHPGARILALSATFFSTVKCGGDCAQALGVAGVLPKPVPRAELLAAVRRLLR
jgi:DNA-binding NarL/FixJ family response regulator